MATSQSGRQPRDGKATLARSGGDYAPSYSDASKDLRCAGLHWLARTRGFRE